MKSKLMTAVGCGAILLTLGACESRTEYRARKAEREALKVVSKLDCPEAEGNLKRTAAAADGLSCTYAGDGSEVTLRLVAVSNDPARALEPIEAELKGLFPALPATPETPTPPAKPGEEPAKTGEVTRETVSMPGLHVETEEGGGSDKAKVRMPGISVDADGDKARVKILGVEINADENASEIRMTRDSWRTDEGDFDIDLSGGKANIKGDGGFSIGGKRRQGYRTTFVKTTDSKDAPWTIAGYEAQGPKRGPLVVAVLKSKKPAEGDGEAKHLFRDATALVKSQFGE
ncbi:hypothetical protein [Caulobacter sp. NIBR1757]|uniref:hypothetical protein n=1 Tax=Caulobacter sp. NIBR1757 TaxID=3016000 RepID=UPI0022F0A07B|nr:hypothetical protein [Caulobacter sp. NIBR1757]WGM38559.1 hypothetical protein AMEJIAPC_01462 [Caulobacter sp. NIBR1757]